MTEPMSNEEIAEKISKGVYLHNSGGNLNSTVGKSIRVDLMREISEALDSKDAQCAEKVGELELSIECWQKAHTDSEVAVGQLEERIKSLEARLVGRSKQYRELEALLSELAGVLMELRQGQEAPVKVWGMVDKALDKFNKFKEGK